MNEIERLTNYYRQMQQIEERLINARNSGDMINTLLIEVEKVKTRDAIQGLEALGFKPNT